MQICLGDGVELAPDASGTTSFEEEERLTGSQLRSSHLFTVLMGLLMAAGVMVALV